MRLTEIIDFLNSKTTPSKEKYREIKKNYRKGLK